MLVSLNPNLSPTLTVSPTATVCPPTSRLSVSSHSLSNCTIDPGTSSVIVPIVCLLVASVTVTGTLIRNRLREYSGKRSNHWSVSLP